MALGHVVLHEPRIVVTQLIAEDVELERRRLAQAIEELTGMIDDMLERGDLRAPASTARCSRPSACSRTTAAGAAASTRRCSPA